MKMKIIKQLQIPNSLSVHTLGVPEITKRLWWAETITINN